MTNHVMTLMCSRKPFSSSMPLAQYIAGNGGKSLDGTFGRNSWMIVLVLLDKFGDNSSRVR